MYVEIPVTLVKLVTYCFRKSGKYRNLPHQIHQSSRTSHQYIDLVNVSVLGPLISMIEYVLIASRAAHDVVSYKIHSQERQEVPISCLRRFGFGNAVEKNHSAAQVRHP